MRRWKYAPERRENAYSGTKFLKHRTLFERTIVETRLYLQLSSLVSVKLRRIFRSFFKGDSLIRKVISVMRR